MRLLSQELLKIANQSATLALAITAFAVTAVLTLFSGATILAEPSLAADPGQMTGLYTDTVYLAWIFPPILGIVLITGEYRFGTAIQTFLQTPRRAVVLWTKMLAATLGGAVIAVASLAGAYFTAWIIGAVAGDAAGPESGRLVGASLALIVGAMVLAALGIAVGALIPSQLPALAVFLGWMLLLEQIVAALLGPVGPYLPGALVPRAMSLELNASGLAVAFDGVLTPLTALVFLAGWAAIVGVIAQMTSLRRDID